MAKKASKKTTKKPGTKKPRTASKAPKGPVRDPKGRFVKGSMPFPEVKRSGPPDPNRALKARTTLRVTAAVADQIRALSAPLPDGTVLTGEQVIARNFVTAIAKNPEKHPQLFRELRAMLDREPAVSDEPGKLTVDEVLQVVEGLVGRSGNELFLEQLADALVTRSRRVRVKLGTDIGKPRQGGNGQAGA